MTCSRWSWWERSSGGGEVSAAERGDGVLTAGPPAPCSDSEGQMMPRRRYEIRIAGRLSARARGALVDMDVHAAPQETVIAGTVHDDEDLNRLLALIHSLGLGIVSVDQVAP